MKAVDIVKKLAELSPRQFEREELTREYIIAELSKAGIEYKLHKFSVTVPIYEKCFLKADGRSIDCIATSFKSGKFDRKCEIVDSLDFDYKPVGESLINYNPYCECISLPNFYDAPSVAISKNDLEKVKNAKVIDGEVEVEKKEFTSCNILAGNEKNPEVIYFAHYDGFFEGVIDNASGVAVCLKLILENRKELEKNLYVFCGSEELSFEVPNYWGKCFRAFEKEFPDLIKSAHKIVIVDCVGTDEPEILNDEKTISLYFTNSDGKSEKICVLTSVERNPHEFLKIYHSEDDGIKGVSEKYLNLAIKKCLSIK